ncbi:hypothetical protein O0L34_g7792 [Tuta absoluta]|nr:hypothetical protein O0L34_g7792 [Tuta absoluta]
MGTFVLFLTFLPLSEAELSEIEKEQRIIKKTVVDIFDIDSITTPRTKLEFWSRYTIYDVKRKSPRKSNRRKIKRNKKYGNRNRKQYRADKRHRVKAYRRRAMALQYNNRRMDKAVNISKNGSVLPPKIVNKETRKTTLPVKIAGQKLRASVNRTIRARPHARTESEEHKIKHQDSVDSANERKNRTGNPANKEPTLLSPYSILQQINEILLPNLESMGANITIEVLGRTMEYNDIVMIKASEARQEKSFRADDDDKFDEYVAEKQIVLIVHGLAVMGFNRLPCLKTFEGLTKLLSYYFNHLDKFDVFVIPMANPDGVAAAISRAYWNKNASPQHACPGVALDRNFDVAWNTSLTEMSSCNQQYPGREPFSEPESQAIRDLFHTYSHRIIGYFNVHAGSYSEDVFKGDGVLYPKGYTDISQNDDHYIDIKGEIDECVKNVSFKFYSVAMETLNSWYGPVYGTSVDFASTVYGVQFALELSMQLFKDDKDVEDPEERETATDLSQVWRRVIDIIFEYMYKTTKVPDKK